MHPSAQPLSPALAAFLADYERLEPDYIRAADEEDRLLKLFERDKPRGKDKAAAFRSELGLDEAVRESDRLGADLAGLTRKIFDAEPKSWPDLVAVAGLVRRRNPADVDGRTAGFYGDTVDLPRHIEQIGAAVARAEAADAVLVEMAARYEVMAATHESRLEDAPNFIAEYDRLFDAIASWCPQTLRGLGAMAKAARLRNSDDLRSEVTLHAERLAGLPAKTEQAHEEGPAIGSLEAIAYDAHKAHLRVGELQQAAYRAGQDGRMLAARALEDDAQIAVQSIDHAFDRGLDIPARTFADVLAGLVAIANNIQAFTHHHDDSETEARMEEIEYRVRRRLYSLRGFIERFAGVRSDMLGGHWCFSSELDPFTNPRVPLGILNVDAIVPDRAVA